MRQQLSLLVDAYKVQVGRHHCVFWEGHSLETMGQLIADRIEGYNLQARELWLIDAGYATSQPLQWYWLKILWGQLFSFTGGYQLHFREPQPQGPDLVPADLPWLVIRPMQQALVDSPWRTTEIGQEKDSLAQPIGYRVENMKTGQVTWLEELTRPNQSCRTLVEGLRGPNSDLVAYRLYCQDQQEKHSHQVLSPNWTCYAQQLRAGQAICSARVSQVELIQNNSRSYAAIRKEIREYWLTFWQHHGFIFRKAKEGQALYNQRLYSVRQPGLSSFSLGQFLSMQSLLAWQSGLEPWLANPDEVITLLTGLSQKHVVKVRFQGAELWLWTSHRLALSSHGGREQMIRRQRWCKLKIIKNG